MKNKFTSIKSNANDSQCLQHVRCVKNDLVECYTSSFILNLCTANSRVPCAHSTDRNAGTFSLKPLF